MIKIDNLEDWDKAWLKTKKVDVRGDFKNMPANWKQFFQPSIRRERVPYVDELNVDYEYYAYPAVSSTSRKRSLSTSGRTPMDVSAIAKAKEQQAAARAAAKQGCARSFT